MHAEVAPVGMPEIEAARARIAALSVRTPLVGCDLAPPGKTLKLKLENLQSIGCFKIRPIASAVLARAHADLKPGIYTTSSGNSALGVAWMARRLGISATAIVPTSAPEAKLEKLRRLGTRIETHTDAAWWRAIQSGVLEDQAGVYIDAVRDPNSLAGDATIGVEILEQWPEVEAIFIPFGGGGLACGIACAIRALKPEVKIIACELASAHPLSSAFAAGGPVSTTHQAGFVSGVGFGQVLPEMWPLARSLIDEAVTVTLAQVADAIRLLAENNRIVAEGAGAISVAAALAAQYPQSKVCAVISGGNIDRDVLASILQGRMPGAQPA
ncbi:MAG TPA: pyridoxal-phosphate dependent enzyme [Steroidobacteraceae bacterium]|jgi:threonine dehydratase|nr:pyridoxal-phosphate dependent enzyme [Steroidobacteraceae bacterium]